MIQQPEIILDKDNHNYYVDGKRKTSPTEVLGLVGVKNEKGYWNSISGSEHMSGTNCEFGNEFHSYTHYRCGLQVEPKKIDYDSQMQPWIDSIELWINKNKKFLDYTSASEVPIYSYNLDICCTPDWVVFLPDGSCIVIDWKSSSQFMPHWLYQTGAYAGVVQEVYELRKLPEMWIIRPEPGKVADEYKSGYLESQIYFGKFRSIYNVYKMRKAA